MQKTTSYLLVVGIALLTCAHSNLAAQTQADEIDALKKKIEQLEEKLENLTTVQSPTADTALEKELAAELEETTPVPGQQMPATATMQTRRGLFQNMNPNVSVVGTLLGQSTTAENTDRKIDLGLQESEFSFQAAVDPYAKADFFVAFEKHGESTPHPPVPGPEEEILPDEHEEGGLQAELEEAYLTLLSLPFSTQLKAGKFRGKFGKLNETHPHAYNFVDLPLMYSNFFGGEGLTDEGVGLSWLMPNRLFFQELTVQVTGGPAENGSFARVEDNKLLYLAHLKNFFDLNENTTLEAGLSGMTGPNSEAGLVTNMFGADLTLKWKPLQQNLYKSFEWSTEFLVSQREGTFDDVTSIGLFSNIRYQLAKRWFAGILFDYSEFPDFSEFNHKAYSGILQFLATEFQKVEFQAKYNDGNFFDSFSEFKLRAVFVIGAHGAHQY